MCAPLAFTPCAVIEYGLLALFLNVITICSPTSALMMGPVAGKSNKSALVSVQKKYIEYQEKYYMYPEVQPHPEFPSVAGGVALSSAHGRCRRCILDTPPSCSVSRSCLFLSPDIYCQGWKTGADKNLLSNSCDRVSGYEIHPSLSPVFFGGVVQLQLPVPLR